MGGASAASPRLEIERRSQWQTSSSNGLPAAAGSASRESHTKSLGFLALRGLFPRAISTRNSLWTTPNDEAGKATVRAHQRLRPPGRCVVQTKACMTNIRSTGAATVKRERAPSLSSDPYSYLGYYTMQASRRPRSGTLTRLTVSGSDTDKATS